MRFAPALLAGLCSLTLSGCLPVVAGVATPMLIRPKHVNLLNSSYAAADILIQQSQEQRYPIELPVAILDLEEVPSIPPSRTDKDRKNVESPMLGRIIATQMRARFQQLGYTLAGVNGVPDSAAVATVSGAYKVIGSEVQVSLRFKDVNGGRVLGITDYVLPTTSEVRKYIAPGANAYPALDWSGYPDLNI